MAGNLEHTRNPLGPRPENGEFSPNAEETGLLSSEILVYEQWLKTHLSTLYQDVLGEPLPNELNEIVKRFTSERRSDSGGRGPTTIASVSVTQLP